MSADSAAVTVPPAAVAAPPWPALTDRLSHGLAAPICLTWELTYGCNLACVHCLSSSGRRDPRELTTGEARRVIDELHDLQVFYVNIGGGEPMIRPDFFELIGYAVQRGVGVKFSTNGTMLTPAAAARLAAMDYLDVQVSIDGADRCDQRRGPRQGLLRGGAACDGQSRGGGIWPIQDLHRGHAAQHQPARRVRAAGRLLRRAVAADQAAASRARRRYLGGASSDPATAARTACVAARPAGRAHWRLVLPSVRSGRAPARAQPVRCGTGRLPDRPDRRRVRMPIRPARAVPRGIGARATGGFTGFTRVWRESELFTSLREPGSAGACSSCGSYDACRGGCMASKFFTGLPLDGPDPECVLRARRNGAGRRCGLNPWWCRTPGRATRKRRSAHAASREPVFVTLGRRG